MSNIFFKIDQFKNIDANIFEDSIKQFNGTLLKSTIGLCHHCHYHVPAYTYHYNNQYWLVKHCKTHGISHHLIERDYEFYSGLTFVKDEPRIFNSTQIITDVTDRCNLECPHCYHIPDNTSKDTPIETLINKYKSWDFTHFILAGAELTVRKDIVELLKEIKNNIKQVHLSGISNGIRLSDPELLTSLMDAGLDSISIGLNHPSYINNPTTRKKQLEGIRLCIEMGLPIGSIGYTMASTSELNDILHEITNNNWPTMVFRIRYGSDIGRYPEQEKLYVSDTYKLVKQWCINNGKEFKDIQGDDTLYHKMVSVDGKSIRIIQWGDETDLSLNELQCGPYADFSSDGITNYLLSVIRRDVEKNQNIMLPDRVPEEYLYKFK